MGSADFHNNVTESYHEFFLHYRRQISTLKKRIVHCYHCSLLASSHVLVRFFFIFLNIYMYCIYMYIICSLWYVIFRSLLLLFLFFRNTQADLCSSLQILVHHYHCKLISRLQHSHISYAWTFLFAGFCLASFSQERNSLLSQAGQQKSISARNQSEVGSSQKWLPWTENKTPKSTCGLPNLLISPFMTASSSVYGNQPYIYLKPFYSSQCAPQNCRRSSKWALDYMLMLQSQ